MKAGEAFHQKHASGSFTACEPARHTNYCEAREVEQQEGDFGCMMLKGHEILSYRYRT